MTNEKSDLLLPQAPPIVPVIIALSILTVLLALFLWNWLPVYFREPEIFYNVQLVQPNQTENNDFVVLINWSEPDKECPIEDARFMLYGLDRSDRSNGQYEVSEVTGKSINDTTFIVFHDNDNDKHLSIGDCFIIKSCNHIDDDGNLSPGYAQSGYLFEIRGGKFQIAEIILQ